MDLLAKIFSSMSLTSVGYSLEDLILWANEFWWRDAMFSKSIGIFYCFSEIAAGLFGVHNVLLYRQNDF